MLMAKRLGNEVGIRNFESNLTRTPWAKKMRINSSFLSNRVLYLVSGFMASNY